MNKPPFYWVHHESDTIGVEYSEQALENILSGPEPVNPISEDCMMKLAQEGYTLDRPWILQPNDRQQCFDKVKAVGLKLDQLKAHFQNPGLDIKTNHAEMAKLVSEINNELYNVLSIAATKAVQEVPEDL